MSWRKHETHKEETKAVKKALFAAGINAKVGHGNGTAYCWLYVEIGDGQQWRRDCHKEGLGSGFCGHCPRCANINKMRDLALKIAQETTERRGDYDGNINIYTQNTITHPNWEDVTMEGAKL